MQHWASVSAATDSSVEMLVRHPTRDLLEVHQQLAFLDRATRISAVCRGAGQTMHQCCVQGRRWEYSLNGAENLLTHLDSPE